VLSVAATGDTLKASIEKAYSELEKIRFNKSYFRSDIGK